MKAWKLVIFLVVLAIVVVFAGFNIDHKSDISFVFYEMKDVPIFLSLFIAFIAGAFVMLPFVFARGRKKTRKLEPQPTETKEKEQEQEQTKGKDSKKQKKQKKQNTHAEKNEETETGKQKNESS
jgi:uncharacterized integral membrane protein